MLSRPDPILAASVSLCVGTLVLRILSLIFFTHRSLIWFLGSAWKMDLPTLTRRMRQIPQISSFYFHTVGRQSLYWSALIDWSAWPHTELKNNKTCSCRFSDKDSSWKRLLCECPVAPPTLNILHSFLFFLFLFLQLTVSKLIGSSGHRRLIGLNNKAFLQLVPPAAAEIMSSLGPFTYSFSG